MNKSLLTGLVAGVAVATAGGVFAGYKMMSGPQYAEVLAVEPIMKTEKTSRQVCEDVAVTHTREAKDQHKVAGTVIGAVVGGVIGNQVGGGDGRKGATVDGDAAGGYDVRYRLGDVEDSVKMDHHPGERIPVQDGQLVLTQPQGQTTQS